MNRWSLLLLLLFVACQNGNIVFEENEKIKEASWQYDDKKSFQFNIDDLDTSYRLLIYLRHTKEYPNENVWLKAATTFPSGETLEDQIELSLAKKDGSWLGSGSGRVLTRELILRDTFKFTEKGSYTIVLGQHMRRNPLEHILDVGLRLERIN